MKSISSVSAPAAQHKRGEKGHTLVTFGVTLVGLVSIIVLAVNPGYVNAAALAASTSAYSVQTFDSTAALDGWVLESSETSGQGGTLNAAGATIRVGDDAQNRQYRSILSFNTSGLPDNAVIVSATLELTKSSVVGINPFTTHGNLVLDIRKPYFGSFVLLELGDFQAAAGLSPAGVVASTPTAGHYLSSLTNTALVYVNKAGRTQLRLRFQRDDNDDFNADYLSFYSGNVITASYKPKLAIKYYVPLRPTPTITPTRTKTVIVTPTITPTKIVTVTPTITPTKIVTVTPTITLTKIWIDPPTITRTLTLTPTPPCFDC